MGMRVSGHREDRAARGSALSRGFYPDFPDTSIKAIIAPEVCHVEEKKVH